MSKLILILLIAAVSFAADSVSKTAIDLMNEGRFQEARTILDSTPASARYSDLLIALTETDALKACGMYLHIAENYPGSDCDSVAQDRLQLAIEMGIDVEAVREEILMSKAPAETPVETKPEALPVTTDPVQMSAITDAPKEEPAEIKTTPEPVSTEPLQTSGMTIDYNVEKKKEASPEEVVQASSTPERIIVEKPMSHAIEVKNETIEPAKTVQTEKMEPAKSEITQPEKIVTAEPVKIENEQLALVEKEEEKPVVPVDKTPAGVQPLPDPNTPHDLETDASANGEWYVQVGAFGNHDNALKLAAKIRSAGYRVILVPRNTNGSELMQVRVGGYFTIEESRAVAAKLKTDFSVPAAVVNK